MREVKGKSIALERTIFHITGKNVYYVESQDEDGHFYYMSWNIDKELEWCSCPDNSMRGNRCKHIYAVEYAIRKNRVVETDKLPSYKKVGELVEIKDMDYKKEEYTF